jgi:hypothetical protein
VQAAITAARTDSAAPDLVSGPVRRRRKANGPTPPIYTCRTLAGPPADMSPTPMAACRLAPANEQFRRRAGDQRRRQQAKTAGHHHVAEWNGEIGPKQPNSRSRRGPAPTRVGMGAGKTRWLHGRCRRSARREDRASLSSRSTQAPGRSAGVMPNTPPRPLPMRKARSGSCQPLATSTGRGSQGSIQLAPNGCRAVS